MSKIVWDKAGERFYHTGVDHVVLYVKTAGAYGKGVPWNGITAINESPSGGEAQPVYADNIKYLNLMSAEEFGLSIEALTYPDEFEVCDGTAELTPGVVIGQQNRSEFGLCYRSLVGSDDNGTDEGYQIHLVYGCLAAPTEKGHATVNETPEAGTFSWNVSTTPVAVTAVPKMKPTAHLVIDSRNLDAAKLTAIENKLYGSEDSEPTFVLPDEIVTLLAA